MRVSRIAVSVRVAFCASILLAVWPAGLAAEDEPPAPAAAPPVKPIRWPSLRSGPLQDNSFLVEEAYNQEPGVVQHISSAHGAAYGNRAIFSPGIRVGRNCAGGVQAVWGIAFPVGVAGNRGAAGVLLYSSIEHGFARKAREERRWH